MSCFSRKDAQFGVKPSALLLRIAQRTMRCRSLGASSTMDPERSVPASPVVSSISVRLGPWSVLRWMVSFILRMLGPWNPDQIMALAGCAVFVHVHAVSFAMVTILYSFEIPPLLSRLIFRLCLRLVLRSFFYQPVLFDQFLTIYSSAFGCSTDLTAQDAIDISLNCTPRLRPQHSYWYSVPRQFMRKEWYWWRC
jgi:hypothetical protein